MKNKTLTKEEKRKKKEEKKDVYPTFLFILRKDFYFINLSLFICFSFFSKKIQNQKWRNMLTDPLTHINPHPPHKGEERHFSPQQQINNYFHKLSTTSCILIELMTPDDSPSSIGQYCFHVFIGIVVVVVSFFPASSFFFIKTIWYSIVKNDILLR